MHSFFYSFHNLFWHWIWYKLRAQLASQVAGCELVDGSKLVEGSRLVEGFNDGSNDGNELVKGSIDDDGTWPPGLLRAPMMASMTAPSLLMAPGLSKAPMTPIALARSRAPGGVTITDCGPR